MDENSKSMATSGDSAQDGRTGRHGRGGWSSGASRSTIARALALTAAGSLLVGIVVAPTFSGRVANAQDTTAPEHTVTVSGTGKVTLTPDVADVVVGVSVQKPTAADARSAAAAAMTSVIAAAKKDGVAEKDIQTTNVSLDPVYDGSSNQKVVGYRFGNTVRLTVRKLDDLPKILDDSVISGATVIQGVAFRVNDPTAAQVDARKQAMRDARAKADVLAAEAGVSVKGVATISETSTAPSPIYYGAGFAMADKAAASTPIQTGTTDVQIQVTVAYLIG